MAHTVLAPAYYYNFSCTGGACTYTCCQKWNINLGRAEYAAIRAARKPKELEQRLRAGMKRHKEGSAEEYAYFTTQQGACTLLGQDGLCLLQKECGAEKLPKTCKTFPRVHNVCPGGEQRSCSTGCIAVIELLAQCTQGLTFVQSEETQDQISYLNQVVSAQQTAQAAYHLEITGLCIDILQNRNLTLAARLVWLGVALRALHTQMEEPGFSVENWCKRYAPLAATRESPFPETAPDRQKSMLSNVLLANLVQKLPNLQALSQRVFEAYSVCITPAPQEEDGVLVQCDMEECNRAIQSFLSRPEHTMLMENIVVNTFFSQLMPLSAHGVWNDYLFLCTLYSVFRFMAAGAWLLDGTEESVRHALMLCSREWLHNPQVRMLTQQQFAQTQSDSVAHMAVLLQE